VHCVQTAEDIDTISFAYDSPRLSRIALCFGLHYQRLLSQILSQSDPLPVDLNVGDLQWQITAEWLEIAQSSKWRANETAIVL